MKRNLFLKLSLGAAAFLATPFATLAKCWKKSNKAIKVDSGKDRFDKPMSVFQGDTFFTKVSTTDTDGDIYLFESTRVKEGGPSLHLHYEQDEYWYIISGEFLFKIGEETFTAKAGDTVFGPRNVPHAFAKVGTGEARVLLFYQPAGKMEIMFKKLSEGVGKNMTEEEKDKFFEEHGLKRLGPPLTYSKW